eukprot:3338944-Rhodomonas_salina.1
MSWHSSSPKRLRYWSVGWYARMQWKTASGKREWVRRGGLVLTGHCTIGGCWLAETWLLIVVLRVLGTETTHVPTPIVTLDMPVYCASAVILGR